MAMLMVGLTGCDGHHDPLDISMKVGHILCTDGKTRSYEDYVASGKEASPRLWPYRCLTCAGTDRAHTSPGGTDAIALYDQEVRKSLYRGLRRYPAV